jgi:hypothetical protein
MCKSHNVARWGIYFLFFKRGLHLDGRKGGVKAYEKRLEMLEISNGRMDMKMEQSIKSNLL